MLNAEKTDPLSAIGLQSQIGTNFRHIKSVYKRARKDRPGQGSSINYVINGNLTYAIPLAHNEANARASKDNKVQIEYTNIIEPDYESQTKPSQIDDTLTGHFFEDRDNEWNDVWDVVEVPTINQPALPL